MATKAKKRALGALEQRLRLVPADGGAPIETVTTPSMWALADEWLDSLIYDAPHSRAWITQKLTQAIYLQAAQAEGAMPPGELSLAAIAEFMNLYDTVVLDDDGNEITGGGKAEADPNPGTPAG